MSSTADYVAKYPRRAALLHAVEKYWLDDARRPPGSLDSSLKKHTTLINKLKSSLLIGPAEALIKDIDGLTLTKYLDEIVAAVVEGAAKKGDPEVAVDVIVHLHSRLTPDFLPQLLQPLLALLSANAAVTGPIGKDGDKDKEKEDKERLSKQRPVLRIVAELAMVGAWAEGVVKGAAEIGKVLKGLMTGDPQYTNLPLITTFLKYFGRAYLGDNPISSSQGPKDGAVKDGAETLPDGVTELVPPEVQKQMWQLFVNYFNTASKTLVKGQLKLLEQDKRNHEAYIKSGEIFEDRQQAYEKMTRAVERLTTGVQTLADLLNLTPPTLPTAASLSKSGLQIVESSSSFTVRDDGPVAGGIWDDEEEQKFYQDLVDLKEVVPASLLGIKEKSKEDDQEGGGESQDKSEEEEENQQKAEEEALRKQLEQMELADSQAQPESEPEPEPQSQLQTLDRPASSSSLDSVAVAHEEEAQVHVEDEQAATVPMTTAATTAAIEEDGLQSGPAARLSALFAALPESNNREVVDKLAVEFAFLNSKAARKRLIKFLGEVPKQRTDLLPHYARLIATLNPYMPDVGAGILEILDEELRYLQRKKLVRELDSTRLKNVRFYGELAKFKVAKPFNILHVLKVFLDDFKFNIENISNLLETCGRFLLRYEGTAEVAKRMVELMRKKQANMHLDQRHQLMLENAFYMCNPPERVVREVVQLTPMQSFIRHLLDEVLMKRTRDKVLKLLRKLHWEHPEVYDFILSAFTNVWEVKFGNIPQLADLVFDLQRWHPEFGIAVVDQVLENIRIDLEENIFKFNQRRIATMKYVGELYMYRVINASVIFEILWSLLSFGHVEPMPFPGRESPIDAVDDFFRVRLACTLLDTCGICFPKGSQGRKLEQYLVMLQLYITCKTELPMDVDFMLTDTLDLLRPKMPKLRTFAQAAAAVDELMATVGDMGGDDSASEDEEERQSPEEKPEEPESVVENIQSVEDDDEDVVLIRDASKNDELDAEERVAFDREFAKILADTTDTRREQRKAAPPIFDTAVPMVKKRIEEPKAKASNGNAEEEGRMQFMLMSKKAGKQQLRTLAIPVDSTIALNSKSQQAQSKAEQEQLKRLVLQNERRLERSEMEGIETRGVKLRFAHS
ncbi:hypothetical protein I315_04869 [Cryptococcus gattii Ru294]|uniref:MIF4G domain-containing protein n=2 Tax=Cryptococcus gattii TaxID=37769 RepID=E6R8E7_CRYGW|nr:uncharacterized protein CGB_F4560W [Cryptococcus gattii WM276]KIR52625.1 hypothetical protein I315_04869 [Cryptococcus gattii Ru294]KIR82510.1 hypothetical protein I306_00344 [Cryptococcus gattii EJB2]KIY33833.1 hypothetical protein I305_03722 [Cryptococcus gattii E566]KJE04189.1 hypothetical protein I311_01996 [Cryptococcus gattii NT-10]ADV23037.1 conserved hypothetical protein [Cryptococcus gattii WM276]